MNYLKKQIQMIFNDNTKTVKEKRDLLDLLQTQASQECGKAKTEITRGYIYCPHCDDYYKEKAWDITEQLVEKQVLVKDNIKNNASTGYAPYYETVEELEFTFECPKGHRITKEKDYASCNMG